MTFRLGHTAVFILPPAAFLAVAGIVACIALAEEQSGTTKSATPTQAAGKSADAASGKKFEELDPKNFINPTSITNKWMPLAPGTRFTFEGKAVEDDGSTVPHRIVVNVTDFTKVIAGIRSLVTWDLDYSDGELAEAELAFFAQDKDGNVWYMGEYPEEYDAGKIVAAPAWIHGFEDARAGIMMKASPQRGTPSYSQGWGPAVGWTDRGKVDQVGQTASVPAGRYTDVIVIAETSAAEANAEQLKHYAPGVGNVKVTWRGTGEKTKETLDLTKVERLDAKGMAEVRAGALKMEKSAYTRSKNVYGRTTPLEQGPGAKTQAPR